MLRILREAVSQRLISCRLFQCITGDAMTDAQLPTRRTLGHTLGRQESQCFATASRGLIFPAKSFSPSITNNYSLTDRFSLAFSDFRYLCFQNYDTSILPYVLLHRSDVCSEILWFLHSPGSLLRLPRLPARWMICSSVCRYFDCQAF